MNPKVKKVLVTIVAILVILVVVFWCLGDQHVKRSAQSNPQISTSGTPAIDIRAYTAGQGNIEKIIADKLTGTENSTLQTTLTEAPVYTEADLILSSDTSTSSLRNYGEKMAIAVAPLKNYKEYEPGIMLSALENKDVVAAQKLATESLGNKKVLGSLLKISVPQSAITIHLKLVNSLSKMSTELSDMSLILDNPYLAMKSSVVYRSEKESFSKTLIELNTFFKNNQVLFPKK